MALVGIGGAQGRSVWSRVGAWASRTAARFGPERGADLDAAPAAPGFQTDAFSATDD